MHTRPEDLYFWGYFVIINAFWIVIPAAVIAYAAAQVSAAVDSARRGAAAKPKRR